jgi:hypothetical protein
MKRPAQPEEIAPAYVFLASAQCSSYITGEILPIIARSAMALLSTDRGAIILFDHSAPAGPKVFAAGRSLRFGSHQRYRGGPVARVRFVVSAMPF